MHRKQARLGGLFRVWQLPYPNSFSLAILLVAESFESNFRTPIKHTVITLERAKPSTDIPPFDCASVGSQVEIKKTLPEVLTTHITGGNFTSARRERLARA